MLAAQLRPPQVCAQLVGQRQAALESGEGAEEVWRHRHCCRHHRMQQGNLRAQWQRVPIVSFNMSLFMLKNASGMG
eukprot:703212-Pelagomonas_calceolata.AAC.1